MQTQSPSLLRRLAWFALLYCCGFIAVLMVAGIFRMLMPALAH